jgi:hypothetical protein
MTIKQTPLETAAAVLAHAGINVPTATGQLSFNLNDEPVARTPRPCQVRPHYFEAQSTDREPETPCEKCGGFHVALGDCTICGHHQSGHPIQ